MRASKRTDCCNGVVDRIETVFLINSQTWDTASGAGVVISVKVLLTHFCSDMQTHEGQEINLEWLCL